MLPNGRARALVAASALVGVRLVFVGLVRLGDKRVAEAEEDGADGHRVRMLQDCLACWAFQPVLEWR